MIPQSVADALPVELLLATYAQGIFPMAHATGELHWHDPDPRAIFELDAIRADARTIRTIRNGRYRVTLNGDFKGVMRGCAQRDETWIDERIISGYVALHAAGHALSVEAWDGERLAGGIYGVRLCRAFFGESMFGRAGAGKVAFHALAEHLRATGCTLFDTQYINDFTRQLGAVEVSKAVFKRRLRAAISAAQP